MELLKEPVVASVKETLNTTSKEELYRVEEVKWLSVMIALRKQDGPLKEVNLVQKRLVKVPLRERVVRLVEVPKDVLRPNLHAVEDVLRLAPPAVEQDQSPALPDAVVKNIFKTYYL
tara:strand:+ start:45 stop:395 length:351 start_codon:yes stop_codon:yes gene_type:complete